MSFFHSMRLFPKDQGAAAYQLTGMAARCDWVLLSDYNPPDVHLHRNVATKSPHHIFLSLRNERAAISTFVESVLPEIVAPFVLVTGSEDVTVPHQIDARRPPFSPALLENIQTILNHPLLLHWFAENLDDASNPKISALPVGMVYPKGAVEPVTDPHDRSPTGARPCRVLCGHRVRDGQQWALRHHVTDLAQTDWAAWSTVLTDEVPEAEYLGHVASHAFVLCVEGGGLDPSPKAWQSLQYGAIPIIRRTATSKPYQNLPVAFVDSWEAGALSAERLARWQISLAPWFDDPDLRQGVLEKLGGDYWWAQVEARTRA